MFSQANNKAGTGIEPRSPSVPGRFNRTLDAVVKKWGITYSGDKRTSVDNFLARLEEGRAVSFLSEEELMIALPFLLDGLALQWFIQNKSSWPTWVHFRAAFRARFGDINYQWRLDDEVTSRVQGEDELTADYPTGRLARWALDLLEYDFNIVHHKGVIHHVPDTLSRMFENERVEKLPVLEPVEEEWYSRRREDVINSPNKFHGWKVVDDRLYKYRSNPLIEDLMEDLSVWKLVVPKNHRSQILIESHVAPEAGHLGTDKTYQRGQSNITGRGYIRTSPHSFVNV